MRTTKGNTLFIGIFLISFFFSTLGTAQTVNKENEIKKSENKWFMAPFKTHRYSLEPSLVSQVGSVDAASAIIGVGGKLRSLYNYRSYFGGLEYSFMGVNVSGSSSNANFKLSGHTGSRDTLSALFGYFLKEGNLRLYGAFHILNKMKLSSVSYQASVKYQFYKDDTTFYSNDVLANNSYTEDVVFAGSGYEVGLSFNLLKRLALNVTLARYNYKRGMAVTQDKTWYEANLDDEKYKLGELKRVNDLPKEFNVTSLSVGLSVPLYFTFLNS
ncbi:MAG: hypothetical protein CME68_10420 [Halobacteriovoraceae bacterium]|nr:hypothetical protein [Halobacteriovoraceae bacterium]